ncbi:MAG TPA: hypothetical protein VFX15_05455 [Actinomycetes bacterium]|nr:hypothetical protein [Actinomycetes bacterium]
MIRSVQSGLAITTVAGLLLFSGGAAEPSAGASQGPLRIDLTASAHPTSVADAHDSAYRVDTAEGVRVRAATTSTASATCRRCAGRAVSVHVLYLDHVPVMRVDNVAVAWTQGCARCRATAVSIQVVVVTDPGAMSPNNRALSITAACKHCRARAAAYQLVVSGESAKRLSGATLDSLRAWGLARARLLRDRSVYLTQRSRDGKARSLDTLEQLVDRDLGAHVVAARARLAGR